MQPTSAYRLPFQYREQRHIRTSPDNFQISYTGIHPSREIELLLEQYTVYPAAFEWPKNQWSPNRLDTNRSERNDNLQTKKPTCHKDFGWCLDARHGKNSNKTS